MIPQSFKTFPFQSAHNHAHSLWKFPWQPVQFMTTAWNKNHKRFMPVHIGTIDYECVWKTWYSYKYISLNNCFVFRKQWKMLFRRMCITIVIYLIQSINKQNQKLASLSSSLFDSLLQHSGHKANQFINIQWDTILLILRKAFLINVWQDAVQWCWVWCCSHKVVHNLQKYQQ